MNIQKKTLVRPVISKEEFEAIATVVELIKQTTEGNDDTDLVVGTNGEFADIQTVKAIGAHVESLMNNLVVAD